ncbi:MAG: RnfABCDGE type electron transport complex subunit D [Intestinimonas sp.]|nr:RnfABCDGE type electron transport complex subunit D [Intestinimonas sp.]
MSEGTRKLGVASSPHVSSPIGTRSLMLDVVISLIPALCIAIYFFGPAALTKTAVSVAACVFFEWGYRKILKKTSTIGDLSAVITGILLVFVCPVTLPYWTIIIGDFFAIVVTKQLFGGLGKNFLNPALSGRAFLMMSYPVLMTTWVKPGMANWIPAFGSTVDAATGATPLSVDFMHSGIIPDASLMDMFIGNIGGCVGEISALMLLIGGVYLVVRGVIRVRIPVSFIATVAVLTFIFPKSGNGNFEWMMYNLLGGGLMLGAIFMATDYVTSPVTAKGEIYYGVGCGLLTVFIRYFGGYPEGVSYAILIMNACSWLLDKAGKPNRFGVTPEMRKAAKEKAKKEASAS